MEVLHREEVVAALLADVVDLHDVGVVQRRGETRLVDEHLDDVRIARPLDMDLLDHDVALEALDAGPAREVLDHLVPAEFLPSRPHGGDRGTATVIASSHRSRTDM